MSRGLVLFLAVLALLPTSVGAAGEIWFDPFFDGHAYSRSRVEPKIRAPTEVAKSLNRVYLDPYFEGTANAKLRADLRLSGSMPATVVQASRNVTPSNLAKAARIAARLSGPALLIEAGLWAYEELHDPAHSDGLLYDPEDGFVESGNFGNAPDAYPILRSHFVGTWGNEYPRNYFMTRNQACAAYRAIGYTTMTGGHFIEVAPSGQTTYTRDIRCGVSSGAPYQGWFFTLNERDSNCPVGGTHNTVTDMCESAPTCPAGEVYNEFGDCVNPTWTAVDDGALEDAIFHRLLAQEKGPDLAKRLIQAGHNPDFDPTQVTGPSSVPGETTTSTSTGPNGEVTTTTTNTYNFNYEGDTVTINRTSTTTIVDGENTTTIVEQTDGDTEPEPDYSLDYQGSTLPAVPDFYEQKYPDGLATVWATRRAELDDSDFVGLITSLTSVAPSSGTCPSWQISFDMGIANFGSVTLEPPCWIWPFIQAVFVITSLFLARRIIFGG